MQYLGIIEQRANELLAAQSYLDSQVGFAKPNKKQVYVLTFLFYGCQDYEKPYDPQETARIILGQVPVSPVQPLLIAPPSTGYVWL